MKPFKTLIAPVVIAALAITGVSTVQAQASDKDVARFIFGAIAVAAIASAIDQSNNNTATVSSTQYRPYRGPLYGNDNSRNDYRYRYNERMRHELNSQCMSSYRDRRGTRSLYEGGCLTRNNRHLARLPRQCAVRVVVRGGRNMVAYEPRCLTRFGFRDQRHDWRGQNQRYRPQFDAQNYGDRRYGHIAYPN